MKKITLLLTLFALVLVLVGCKSESLQLYDLRCENLENPLAIDSTTPHFSWKINSALNATNQTHYEIMVASNEQLLKNDQADIWSSGKIASDESVMVKYAGAGLQPRSLAFWKVRVWDNHGNVSAWSKPQRFGIGILSNEMWSKSEWIGVKDCKVPMLRKQFEVSEKGLTHLIHINSLGYHELYLNGKRVGDNVLAPAVSELDTRSLSVTYDITPYLKRGENDLVVWLGRGWYRKETFNAVHEGPLVRVELDCILDSKATPVLYSDASWMGIESCYSEVGSGSWHPNQFGGESLDGNKILKDMRSSTLNALQWQKVWVAQVPPMKTSPQMCEPNHILEHFAAKEVRQVDDSTWFVDMGKTMNGWVDIDFPQLSQGDQIKIEYSDRVDKEGNFSPQDGNSINYEDHYIASGKKNESFSNKFNHHGFQYMRITGLNQAPKAITGLPICATYKDASTFDSSDKDMVAIYELIKNTFKKLAWGGYVVDCPQYERMGYGGDGNSSCRTFQAMYDAAPLYQNWMQMWEDCQQEDGGMPHCVPNPYKAGGGPYWCGFIITASWQTYLNYGDKRLLERHYPQMQKWLGYVEKFSVNGLLQEWENVEYRWWYLGDWLSPHGVDYQNKESVALVSNCYVSYCLDVMSKIATELGKPEDAKEYKAQYEAINKLIHEQFYKPQSGEYGTGTQIDMIYPLLAGIAPEDIEKKTTELINNDPRNSHIGVGLVGIQILTDWATDFEQTSLMYNMLKKRDYPGYLYMIDNGATATWEEWGAGRSRIHNCFNGIGAWFIQAMGGILPDEKSAGYKHIILKPQIPQGVEWTKVSKESPYGTISSAWHVGEQSVDLDITIPANSTATLYLPCKATKCTINSKEQSVAQCIELESGVHHIVLTK